MTIEHSAEQDEKGTRQQIQEAAHHEYADEAGRVSEEGTSYSRSLLGHSSLQGRGNAGVRAAVMHSAQQTHGNHAVQRAVQRSTNITVQRFQRPDEEYDKETSFALKNGFANAMGAVPVLGNVWNGFLAAAGGFGYLAESAAGNDLRAENAKGMMEQHALQAIPLIGNAMSAKNAATDFGAYAQDKWGNSPTPAPTAEDEYQPYRNPDDPQLATAKMMEDAM